MLVQLVKGLQDHPLLLAAAEFYSVHRKEKTDKHRTPDTKKAALLSDLIASLWCEGRTQITLQLYVLYENKITQNLECPLLCPRFILINCLRADGL